MGEALLRILSLVEMSLSSVVLFDSSCPVKIYRPSSVFGLLFVSLRDQDSSVTQRSSAASKFSFWLFRAGQRVSPL